MSHKISLLAILVVLVFASAELKAQGLHAIYSRDGTDVWAAGDGGALYRSFTSGLDWTVSTLGSKTWYAVAAQGLDVWVAGEDGEIQHSTDNGGTWMQTTVTGLPDLFDLEMTDATTGYVVGDAGSIFKTTNGGTSWSALTSGTTVRLTAVRFRDADTGWTVGHDGTVLRTVNGGTTWTPVTIPTSKNLYDVDYFGSKVWVVGHDATALWSDDDGSQWTVVDLGIESMSDVTGVWLEPAGTVRLTGGGGFIRSTSDNGATWVFSIHPMHSATSDFFFTNGGQKGWACARDDDALVYTLDGGLTWSLPSGTSKMLMWLFLQNVPDGHFVRGNTLALNGQNKNSVYCLLGGQIYKSLDRGDTWAASTSIPGAVQSNALYVSPNDSLQMVSATALPDRIMRSTDGGQTWLATLVSEYSEYGVPLEMDRDDPQRFLFAPEDGVLYESTDAGASFQILSVPGFRSPCDLQIVPDASNVVYVSDGITELGNGELFRSTDGGLTFNLEFTADGTEIPMIAAPRHNNSAAIMTNWSFGGVWRTNDYGDNWQRIALTGAAWGVDYARDDPNVFIYGVYGGGASYLSFDDGQTYSIPPLGGANYAFFAIDRATVLALQSFGIYKLSIDYTLPTDNTQSLTVTSPNGGEIWTEGEVHAITWNATHVGLARIEYRNASTAPWQLITEIEGYAGTYDWTVPDDPTTEARIRILDVWDTAPIDSSDADFTIQGSPVAIEEERADTEVASIQQEGPNPFSRSTLLRYRLPTRVQVRLEIFDLQGRRIATLVDTEQQPGEYLIPFGSGVRTASGQRLGDLAAGVYFGRLQAGIDQRTFKMVMTR